MAAHRLPPKAEARYGEEWLAELDAFRGRKLRGLLFAFQLLFLSSRMSAELDAYEPESELAMSDLDPTIQSEHTIIVGEIETSPRGSTSSADWTDVLTAMKPQMEAAQDLSHLTDNVVKDWDARWIALRRCEPYERWQSRPRRHDAD